MSDKVLPVLLTHPLTLSTPLSKDPTAPRRNPSAFLLYSVKKRKEIKKNNPDLKTTDISRMLGRLWRETSEEEKRPYVEREEIERVQYKEKMCAWKKKKEKKDREEAEARKLTPLEAVEIKKPCDDSIGETFDHIEEDLSSNENSPYPTRDSHAEFYNQDTPEAVPSGGEQWFNWDTNEMTDPQVPILPSSPPRRYSPYKEIHHHRKYHPPTPHQSPQEQHHHHHHHHHHPRRVESHHAPRRYSPIPLYRETNMFCPSPITRQAEAFQYHQPEDVTSRSWPAPPNSYQRERADPNRPLENAFAHDITEADFDRYDKSNQFYKHDPELDCSPIGSYDEFDAQFDPVPIH